MIASLRLGAAGALAIGVAASLSACQSSSSIPTGWVPLAKTSDACKGVAGRFDNTGDYDFHPPVGQHVRAKVSLFNVLAYGMPVPENRLGRPTAGASSKSSYRWFEVGSLRAQTVPIRFFDANNREIDVEVTVLPSRTTGAPCGGTKLRVRLAPHPAEGTVGMSGLRLATTLDFARATDGTLAVHARSGGCGVMYGFLPQCTGFTYWMRFAPVR